MGKLSNFMRKLYDYEEVEDDDENYEAYNDGEYNENVSEYDTGYESFQEEVPYSQQQPIPVKPSTATVVMLTPYDIRTSQIVCDHLRAGHIVICNLTPNANNQRVVDYISGAAYSIDGNVKPIDQNRKTFVVAPRTVALMDRESLAKQEAEQAQVNQYRQVL